MIFDPNKKEHMEIFAFEELRANLQYEIMRRMKERNISRSDLAEKIGESQDWVSQILGDDGNLTLEGVAKIFIALGLRCHISSKPL